MTRLTGDYLITVDSEKKEITFFRGSHDILIRYNEEDFEKLVKPLLDDLEKTLGYLNLYQEKNNA